MSQLAARPAESHRRVSNHKLVRILRTAVVVGGASAVIGTAIFIGSWQIESWWTQLYGFVTMFSCFFAVFVWLAVPEQPRNAVIWTMAASALCGGLSVAGEAVAAVIIDDPGLFDPIPAVVPADLPFSAASILMVTESLSTLAFVPLMTFGLLLFPDGTLASPRWRWVGWLAAGSTVAATVGLAWGLRPWNKEIADAGLLVNAGFTFAVLAVLLSLASLVVRFRRSSGTIREQFKWVVWGAAIFAPVLAFAISVGGTRAEDLALAPLMLAGAVFLVSYGMAVGRYRLYDIDPVVNKTFMVAGLVAVIALLYVAVVTGVGSVVGSSDSARFYVQVAATAIVAIAFAPVRRRAQAWANRLVYGERASAYEILARFSHRAAEASDDELLARVPRLIVDGTGAREATLWVKDDTRFRAAATWPEPAVRRELAAAAEFNDPEADHCLPVHHDGELLGGLSLVKSRGEALTSSEARLVSDLAAGMGLALRNARLTSELRQRVRQLEASRERVLAAADEARRALERDLDSGPQQQLVALKVMLGPSRKQAEQVGATKTAEVLAQLERDAGEAIKAVREFSGGVYPPLLEAEGLAVAVKHRTDRSALQVNVDANGLGRYPREVEAAVYFTILEALQNVAKYASADSVSVELRDSNGILSFEVKDDGIGFDRSLAVAGSGLANMSDRLDAVGGALSIESSRGEGTLVKGSAPVPIAASA